MGNLFSALRELYRSQKPQQISIVGLDSAGKTTILYAMGHTQVFETIPTIGFNQESFVVNKTTFSAWDLGGQSDIRPLWEHYVRESIGLVFVIDIMDSQRWPLAAEELNKILQFFRNKPVLVLANKADRKDDASIPEKLEEIKAVLGLSRLDVDLYHITDVAGRKSADNPEPKSRLYPAFTWLSDKLN